MEISVVIPVYGCRKALFELHERLVSVLTDITDRFQIVLVNDACPQGSWEDIKIIADKDRRVTAVNLSRNFGQYNAIAAGIDNAIGEWTVVMDCDLQNRPEEIAPLYEKAKEGFDIVLARRQQRKDSSFRRYISLLSRKVLGYLTEMDRDPLTCNFGIYSRRVIETIKNMPEYTRAFEKMVDWVGFKSTAIDVKHVERSHGESSYTLKKLFQYAFDQIFAFSYKPLEITVFAGAAISIISFIVAAFVFFRALIWNYDVTGWASLMVSIWFLAGLIIFILGMIGIYIGKILDEVKKRPCYIISDRINGGEK